MVADTVFPQITWYRFSLDVRRAEDILEWLQNGIFTNTIPWISDVIKHLRNISSLVLFIWMPEVWNTELLCQLWKTSTSFLFSQNTVPFAGFCSLFHHQAEGEVCRDFSVWCRVHNCRAKYQVAVSFPCLFFFSCFQKSLRTLSQLHQKVSSDSYFLFKRRETICVAINFLSRLFYIVRTNQNSLLKNHCFLPAWTKYSLSSVTVFKPTTVQQIAVTKTIKLPPAVVIYTSNMLFNTPVTHMAYTYRTLGITVHHHFNIPWSMFFYSQLVIVPSTITVNSNSSPYRVHLLCLFCDALSAFPASEGSKPQNCASRILICKKVQ